MVLEGRGLRYEWAIMAAVIVAAGFVLWQFFTPLLLAMITAYVLYPVVNRIKKIVYFYNAALIITILALLLPLAALVNYIAGDVSAIIASYNDLAAQVTGFFASVSAFAESYGLESYTANLPNLVNSLAQTFKAQLLQSLTNLPHILLGMAVYLLATYYMLKDGDKAMKFVMKYVDSLHIRDRDSINNFFEGLKNSFDVLFIINIGMSIVSALIVGLGFYLFGVPYPAVFTLLVALFGFLPVLGSWIAYVGAGFMLHASGGSLFMSVLVVAWGFVFANLIPDFLLRPWIGSKVGKVHPLTILLGFFGGPFLFGAKGLILGPIILVIAETVIRGFLELHTSLNNKQAKLDATKHRKN